MRLSFLTYCLLVLSVCYGQKKLYVGASWGEYGHSGTFGSILHDHEKADIAGVNNFDYLNVQGYAQFYFNKGWGIHGGYNWIRQEYTLEDHLTTDFGFGDVFTDHFKASANVDIQEFNLALQKSFDIGRKFAPYFRVGGTYSLIAHDPQFVSTTGTNEFSTSQVRFSLLTTNVESAIYGLKYEVGYHFPLGDKVNFTMGVAWNRNFAGNIVKGSYTAYEEGNLFNLYAADVFEFTGSYWHLGFGLQARLYKQDNDKKDKKKEEKEREKEEKLLAQKEQDRLKEEQKLAKEKEKEQAELAKLEEAKRKEEEKKRREEEELLAKENEDKLKTDASGKPKELKGRGINIQQSYEVTTTTIELFYWDSGAEIDGDSVSIFFNGEWVAENILLTKERRSIQLTLDPKKKNYLIIYAINEGVHPPNTASVLFFDGVREKKYRIHSKVSENGAISFKYNPPKE